MAWIRVVGEGEASGELREAYARVKDARGKISQIMAVHSLHPKAMLSHLDLYLAIMFAPSGLTREEREAVAVAVSAANGCAYCVAHHAEALKHYWKDEARVDAVIRDPRAVDLPPRLRAMVDYALKLTKEPKAMGREDIAALKSQGLTDEEILSLNLVVSYFNFVNRVALGLGVEPEEQELKGYKY